MSLWNDCDLEDIIEKLQNARHEVGTKWGNNRAATLFIGAGCSISAGVPLARDIVKENKTKFAKAYARAKEKAKNEDIKTEGENTEFTDKEITYPQFMAELDDRERHDIHLEYIDKAKINWAHIAIIQLMEKGYIDRVITVNFDDLLIRAGAMLGFVPVVYDVTQLKDFNSFFVPKPAVFYIHGQHSGFSKIYTQKQDERNKKSIHEVLKNSMESSPTIVLGYSGESDPVFELLKEIQLTRSLYWLEYSDCAPKDHILPLLQKDNTAYLRNQDADLFLVELCQGLEVFPPKALTRPFSHLQKALDDLTNFPLKDSKKADFFSGLRQMLDNAIQTFEPSVDSEVSGSSLLESLLSDNPDEAIRAIERLNGKIPEHLKNYAAWAYIKGGDALLDQTRTKTGAEGDGFFERAIQRYARAVEIKSDEHVAFYNWGLTLAHYASTKTGVEANSLFEQAIEKYTQALKIKPDNHEAFYSWGIALSQQAKTKTGVEADRLWKQTIEKFSQALNIEPNFYLALQVWGSSILLQISTKTGLQRQELLEQARGILIRYDRLKPRETYNLACLEALSGNETECLKWLENCLTHKTLPSCQHLSTDTDLYSVRKTAWFQEFMLRAGCSE
jgi:tetratricopeptide (TPR) repeat protein